MTPLLIPVTILALGSQYECDNCSPFSHGPRVSHPQVGAAILLLMIFHLLFTFFLITLAKGARLAVAALQAMYLWCTFWSALEAIMSVSGTWI